MPVEDVDGNIINPPAVNTATTPALSYKDNPPNPPNLTSPGAVVSIVGSNYCANPGFQLFYHNTPGLSGLPTAGNICVNKRDNSIPSDVIAVNKAAHDAMRAYNANNGITQSPWLYYKLVNVQAFPFDKSQIDYTNPNGMYNPATYFQANIVVETNYTLQLFHGRFGQNTGSPTDFPTPNSSPPPASYPPPPNVYIFSGQPNNPSIRPVNMGGCMGCHGNAQVAGSDFSFILNQSSVHEPDFPAINRSVLIKKYLSSFNRP